MHLLLERLSKVLKLPLHLLKLTKIGLESNHWQGSPGLIRADLVMQGWLLRDMHFVWSETLATHANNPLRQKSLISNLLLNPEIILY